MIRVKSPPETCGCHKVHPRKSIDRRELVGRVRGSNLEMCCRSFGDPSIGQRIEQRNNSVKKTPKEIAIMVVSVFPITAITAPRNTPMRPVSKKKAKTSIELPNSVFSDTTKVTIKIEVVWKIRTGSCASKFANRNSKLETFIVRHRSKVP